MLAGPGGLPRFGAVELVTQAHFVVLPGVTILMAGALYLYGVRRLAARGDAWPISRSICFVGLGLGTVALALCSGLAAYDEVLFGAHMVQHMLLSMVATVFLALGAPVTLALRTLPQRPRRLHDLAPSCEPLIPPFGQRPCGHCSSIPQSGRRA